MKKVLLAVVILVALVVASCGAKTETKTPSTDSTNVDSVKVIVDTVKVVK